TTFCKHLSIQLSENEGDIIQYCQKIKNQSYSDDVDIIFILGGDGTINELVNGIMQHELDVPIGIITGGTFNEFVKTFNISPLLITARRQLIHTKIHSYDVMILSYIYSI